MNGFCGIAVSRFNRLPPPVQGALLMTGVAFGYSLMNAMIRYGAGTLNPLQIAFFRTVFTLIFLLPWVYGTGFARLPTGRLRLYAVRAFVGYLTLVCWFTALALMPLAEAVSLTFTAPLFATAGAAILLGEIVGIRRWTATAVGFLGVLVIIRPGLMPVSWVTTLPILAAVFLAVSTLMIKPLSRTEDSRTIVLYLNLFLAPICLVPALFVWQWPDLWTLAIMAAIGLISVGAQLFLTMAFARTEASIATPFLYLQLPFVSGIGFIAFGETPEIWTIVGAMLIALSAIYIVRREARVAPSPPSVPGP